MRLQIFAQAPSQATYARGLAYSQLKAGLTVMWSRLSRRAFIKSYICPYIHRPGFTNTFGEKYTFIVWLCKQPNLCYNMWLNNFDLKFILAASLKYWELQLQAVTQKTESQSDKRISNNEVGPHQLKRRGWKLHTSRHNYLLWNYQTQCNLPIFVTPFAKQWLLGNGKDEMFC